MSNVRLARGVPGSRFGWPGVERRAMQQRVAELPVLLDELAASVRGGHSITGALRATTGHLTGPLRRDFVDMCARLDTGLPLAAALALWADQHHQARSIRTVASALTLASRSGGPVASAIDSVAETVRSELAMQAEASALAAQAYASAVLVAFLPIFFGAIAAVTDPTSLRFFLGSKVGLGCLMLGICTDGVGWYWMRHIIRAANPA